MKVQEVDFAGHGEAHHVVEGSGDFGNLGELDAAALEVAVRATTPYDRLFESPSRPALPEAGTASDCGRGILFGDAQGIRPGGAP